MGHLSFSTVIRVGVVALALSGAAAAQPQAAPATAIDPSVDQAVARALATPIMSARWPISSC
jgi:hypothetical protein